MLHVVLTEAMPKCMERKGAKYSQIKKANIKTRKSSKVQRVTSLGITLLQNGPPSDYTTKNRRFFEGQFYHHLCSILGATDKKKCPGRRHVSAEPLYETLRFPSSVLRSTLLFWLLKKNNCFL